MALNLKVKNFAQRILPRSIVARLDPVEDLIESEVRDIAGRMESGQIILDAGAGEARHRKYFKRGRYVALDAAYGDKTWDYSNLDLVGDVEDIPLRDDSVDYILCMSLLEHTRNPRKVLLELGRVLKPGGILAIVVPFLWEEHQIPHDYFRYTRYGLRYLFDGAPFRLEAVSPIGGFFRVCARRSVAVLNFFQGGWRWILFALLAPFFGLLLPLILHFMDGLDREKNYSLGFRVRATKLQR